MAIAMSVSVTLSPLVVVIASIVPVRTVIVRWYQQRPPSLQTQRTCSTFNAGAVEGAIGIAPALVAANAASAAEESRTAIGLLIEALREWISLMERVCPCWAELQLNVRRTFTPSLNLTRDIFPNRRTVGMTQFVLPSTASRCRPRPCGVTQRRCRLGAHGANGTEFAAR